VANSRIIDFHRKFQPMEVAIDKTEIYVTSDFTEVLVNTDLLKKIASHISTLPSDIQRFFLLLL
jgi:hypothetical protein